MNIPEDERPQKIKKKATKGNKEKKITKLQGKKEKT
jgi:hypothetical protein